MSDQVTAFVSNLKEDPAVMQSFKDFCTYKVHSYNDKFICLYWRDMRLNPEALFTTISPEVAMPLIAEFLQWRTTRKPSSIPAIQTESAGSEATKPMDDIEMAMVAYRELTGEFLHPAVYKLLKKLLAGRNVYLWGPAGSGKSLMVSQATKILGNILGVDLAFYDMVAGANFSEFDFLAKAMPVSIEGQQAGLCVIRSPYMQAFAAGNAVAFVDEQDVAPPEANLSINGGLEQRRQFDPSLGKTIPCGDNFFYVSAGNTNLEGPTPEYPARFRQDSAFISRFVTSRIFVDYADQLESQILNPQVHETLKALRVKAKKAGLAVEISTRLGVAMTAQINSGRFTFEEVFMDWVMELSENVRRSLGLKGVS